MHNDARPPHPPSAHSNALGRASAHPRVIDHRPCFWLALALAVLGFGPGLGRGKGRVPGLPAAFPSPSPYLEAWVPTLLPSRCVPAPTGTLLRTQQLEPGTTPTMLGTAPTMLGTTPTMLGTTPTMLGTTPTMLCTRDGLGIGREQG